MTVFFRLLNDATSSSGSRVQTLVVREGRESRGPREGESKPPPWPSGPSAAIKGQKNGIACREAAASCGSLNFRRIKDDA